MFTKRHNFTIDNADLVDFMRILGAVGVRFEISDLKSEADCRDPMRKVFYRIITVHGTKKQIAEIHHTISIIANYHRT